MTQLDYEQKKRECWEEFCRANPSHNKSIFARKVFAFAFDRAYALGKQFGNSEQVDVEKAAKRFADEIRIPASIPGVMVPFLHDIAKSSYLQGAQDFLGKQESKPESKQESKQETVIQGWVARDAGGFISLFSYCPDRVMHDNLGFWGHNDGSDEIDLPKNSFPDLTWSDDPIEVELIIKRKKNG